MRKYILFSIIGLAGLLTAAPTWACVDKQCTSQTQDLLNYLTSLPDQSPQNLISGQYDYSSRSDVNAIHSATGKWVGLLGGSFYAGDTSGADLASYSTSQGMIVTQVWLFNNPDGSNPWTSPAYNLNLVNAIAPGTSENTYLNGQLDLEAAQLQVLANAGVPVIWRPLPEMNSDGVSYCTFWWCGRDATQYINVWKYIVNYMTVTKGLHNLLFLWAPVADGSGDFANWYPGNAYVDIVGPDVYGYGTNFNQTGPSGINMVSMYNSIQSLTGESKPFVLAEYGTCYIPSVDCPAIDLSVLANNIKSQMPKTVYWMNWNEYYRMEIQDSISNLLSNSSVLNAPINYSPTPTPSPTPPPSANLALNKPATASSIEGAGYEASLAVDGNLSTRWSSAWSDPQWLQIDLGSVYSLNQIVLKWEAAYGKSYQLQLSNDSSSWTTVYTQTNGSGGIETIPVSNSGRYLRLYGTTRATQYGYSLYEIEAYGTAGDTTPPAAPSGVRVN